MMKLILSIISLIAMTAGRPMACATADLIAGLQKGDVMPQIRPGTQHEWGTPGGFFLIHYDTEGEWAVYHADEDVNPADGVPDYVNRLGEFLEESYNVIIGQLGYDPPPFDGGEGGDNRYDIYITNVPARTSPESPSDQYPGRPAYSSYIQLGHDMRSPRYPDDPYPLLKVSAAHEFFHATQFAYRVYSSDASPWWFESTACWAEEMVFDDVNDVYFRLPFYLPYLHRSLYQTDSPFVYGAWLFPEYLSERIGPWIIRRCWEKFASFDLAMEAIIRTFNEFGLDFRDQYCNHIIWDYFTGDNYRDGFYQEAAYFGETVHLAGIHYFYPVPWTENPVDQENVSGVYIEFRKPQSDKGSLVLEYSNPTDDVQSICVAVVRFESSIETSVYRSANHAITIITVPDIADCEKVIMMPVWCYEGLPRTGTTHYAYRAYIDSTHTLASEQATSPVGLELTRLYPNPFNGSVTIEFSSPADGDYRLGIYDIGGGLAFEDEETCRAGLNRYVWKAPADLAAGVYFYRVSFGSQSTTGRMLYLK